MPVEFEPPQPDLDAREVAWAAINEVIDPCSRFNGSHLGLVDLGMVKDVSVEGQTAKVTLLLDDPVCIYTFLIQKEIREALEERGIDDVEIHVCADELWTADRLSQVARVRLGRTPTQERGGQPTVPSRAEG
jgi:ring-1,2-phenylacetyl-CoA epoxidase subunit PaaD